MAVESGFMKPSNTIVASGTPFVRQLTVETATNMYPGRCVKRGTAGNDIVVNDASGNEIVGFLGYEQAGVEYMPATRATAYAADDFAPVISGAGTVIYATLATSQTITSGETLRSEPDGCLGEGTAGTDQIVAIALEDVTTTTAVAGIWVQLTQ